MKSVDSSTFTAELVRTPNQAVVRVAGRLIAAGRRSVLEGGLEAIPGNEIGLDLGAVTHMDASGLGLLADFVRQAQATGRRVSVVSVSRRARRLLEVTGLGAVLDRGNQAPRAAA